MKVLRTRCASEIAASAAKSNVGLSDFSLQIGDITSTQVSASGFSSLLVSFTVRGSITDTQHFMTELKQSAPLSNILSVQSGTTSSSIAVEFYFKPIAPTKNNFTSPLRTLNKEELQLLNTLGQWISNAVQ